jgi:hypothetical protein
MERGDVTLPGLCRHMVDTYRGEFQTTFNLTLLSLIFFGKLKMVE